MVVSIAFPRSNYCQDLQPDPNINITARDFRRAKENVSTIPSRPINPHGVLAAVGSGAVKGDFAALVAVRRVGGPYSLIPSAFKVLGDLGKGEGEEGKGEKSGFEEHCCGWAAVGSR